MSEKQLMELAISKGGIAANLAGQNVQTLKFLRAWCDWLLKTQCGWYVKNGKLNRNRIGRVSHD